MLHGQLNLKLKLIIPLLIIGGVVIIGLLIANNHSTPSNQTNNDSDLSSVSQAQNSTNPEADQPLTTTDNNLDLTTTAETDLGTTDSTAASPARSPLRPTDSVSSDHQSGEKLNLQLALNFHKLLVETDVEASKDYYTSTQQPTCGDQDMVEWIKITNNSVDNLKHGSWVCIRARSQAADPYQYQSMQIDLTKPTIHLRQQLSSIFVSTKPSHVANVDYFQSSTKPSCNGQDNHPWQDLNGQEIKNTEHNYWVCLRAQIRMDSIFNYKLFKVNLQIKPDVDLQQEGSKVLVTFSLQPVYNAGWFKAPTKPECSDQNSAARWRKLTTDSLEGFNNQDWVCVRGANTAYGYQLLQVDLNKPTLNLRQTGNLVTFTFPADLLQADPAIMSRTYWSQIFNQATCQQNNKNIAWQPLEASGFSDLQYGRSWLCIHLINKLGVENYQVFAIHLSRPSRPPVLSISAVQHNKTFHLTFSQATATDKKYATSTSKPNCSTATGYTAVSPTDTVANLTINDWVCVVATFNGRQYYLRQQVLTPPSIETTQYTLTPENDVARAALVATFKPVDAQSQQYAITASNDCASVDWSPLPTNLVFTANETVCLRARDSQGVWGDLARQYTASAPPAYSNIATRSVMVTWPLVDQGHYFVSPNKPTDCNRSRSHDWLATPDNPVTINVTNNGDWICLKTTETINSQTVVSFFEHQHLHTPTIFVDQHGNKTIATQHNSVPLGVVKYHFISDGDADCSENTTTNWSQTATYITATKDNAYICLRLQDGPVTAYRSYQLKTVQVITINVSGNTMTVVYPTISLSGVYITQRYLTANSEPACNQTTPRSSWRLTASNPLSLTNQANGTYLCGFISATKAAEHYKLTSYAKRRLVIQPTVTLTGQNQNALTFSFTPANATSKQYYTTAPGANNKPVCSEADTTRHWTTITNQTLTLEADTPVGQWICVKVTDGPFSGYTVIEFQKESPAAEIVQSDYKFYVSPGHNQTCAGDDSDDIVECKYFKSSDDPDCTLNIDTPNESNKWQTFSKGVLSDTYNANQYICVKLKNKRGYSTYSERKAITMVVMAIYEQTSDRIRVQYQHGNRALGSTRYYTQVDEPTCDYSTIAKANITISDRWTNAIPAGHWVCISVRNYNISIKHQAWSFLKAQDK